MVTRQEIDRQLEAINTKFTWWGRGEVRELEHIIEPGETIMYCLNGRYEGGFGMLCVTDQRAILIDKKPLYLSLEDVRYDMISEVHFDGRLLDSSVTIHTFSKQLRFTALKGKVLRRATAYLQRRVLELRQHPTFSSQFLSNNQTTQSVQSSSNDDAGVHAYEHKVINPYLRAPLMMRRRVSRF